MKFILILMGAMLFISSNAQAEIIELKLIQQYTLEDKSPIRAMFSDLSEKEIQSGIDTAQIIGKASMQNASGNKYQVTIKWHTIANSSGLKEPLKSNLISRFKIKKGAGNKTLLDSGTLVKAKGSMKKVASSFKKIGSSNKPNNSEALTTSDAKDEAGKSLQLAPALAAPAATTTSGGALPAIGNPTPASSNGNAAVTSSRIVACDPAYDLKNLVAFQQQKTEKVNDQGQVIDPGTCGIVGNPIPITKTYGCQQSGSLNEWYELSTIINGTTLSVLACTEDVNRPITNVVAEVCPVRFDIPAMTLFEQSKDVTYDGAGNIISQTACADTAISYPVTKEYNQVCQPFIDTNAMLATDAFRYVATINGSLSDVGTAGCINDNTRQYPITETTNGCSVRDDLPLQYSIEQSRLIYIDGNATEQTVRGCQDSTNPLFKYPHSFSTVGCSVIVDPATGRNVPQQKTVYQNSAGQTVEAAPCAITGATVGEQFCQGQFIHDIATKQSKQLVQTFLTDGAGNITWMDATCSPSASVVYAHVNEACGYTNNDTTRQSTALSRVIIDTTTQPASTAGIVEVQPCASTGIFVPYVEASRSWVLQTTRPSVLVDTRSKITTPGIIGAAIPCPPPPAFNVWPAGLAVNTNGWSKDTTTTYTYESSFQGGAWTQAPSQFINGSNTMAVSWGSVQYRCTRQTYAVRNDYVTRISYDRPDGTTFVYDDPVSLLLNSNVAGGTTAQPTP